MKPTVLEVWNPCLTLHPLFSAIVIKHEDIPPYLASCSVQREKTVRRFGLENKREPTYPPTSYIFQSTPFCLPVSSEKVCSITPTVFNRAFKTSSSEGIYRISVIRERESR